MAGINKAILIGNLGRDPETRTLESGVKVTRFPMATTETFKNKDGVKTDQTEWHNIVLWRGLAEVAEKYLRKGDSVYIEGKISYRQWDDKDGNKRYTTDIVADNMTMLGGARRDDPGFGTPPPEKDGDQAVGSPAPEPGDDLPF
jgi:single-strand DNA-binding protein